MNTNMQGKVALVAGGTGGLGRAVSLAFLGCGAHVVATYVKKDEFATLQAEAGDRSSSLSGYSVDVTDDEAVRATVEMIVPAHRRIDILVNTVGSYVGGTKLWATDPKVFSQMFDLNVRSGYLLARNVVPVMLKQGVGVIVNIAAKAAYDHAAGASVYAASKAAAVAMIDSLAEDLKGTNVRVNSILPSIIDTSANRRAMPNADFSKWPKPEEIARVILFLCSEEALLIHGASIPVYGNFAT
ncbi:MAG TPA: SDR family NAD(P)-dependent oxidoreductase [Terriglobales bacterium]|jgi:NAD(P)-dependent dehydrogenase (short-subunit alcohol dehydrogenase family)|nr:SDR family NAD(P)-dependent oxidoreductase [Terriglobales bacterium]